MLKHERLQAMDSVKIVSGLLAKGLLLPGRLHWQVWLRVGASERKKAPPPAPTLARVGAGGGAFLRSDAPTLSQTCQCRRPGKRRPLASRPLTIFTLSIACKRSCLSTLSRVTCKDADQAGSPTSKQLHRPVALSVERDRLEAPSCKK